MKIDNEFAEIIKWLEERSLELHIPLKGGAYLTNKYGQSFKNILPSEKEKNK